VVVGVGVTDPRGARTVGNLVAALRAVKVGCGNPSVRELARRVKAERQRRSGEDAVAVSPSTVWYCFDPVRQRLDYDLVFDLLRAMRLPEEQLAWWRQAWQAVFAVSDQGAAVVAEAGLLPQVPTFSGRSREVSFLLEASRPTGTPAVVAVEGMAGIGKSWLVTRVAHELLRRGWYQLPLSVQLRGFDPEQQPATPEAALAALLRALGIRADQIPHDPARLARAYRNALRQRRALVLLDDAADADQVRPLLPGRPDSLVLVTSRRALDEIATRQLELDVLTPAESIEILRRVEPQRVAVEPDAAAGIAERCGHLPLALGLAAGQLRSRPDWPLADHLERLHAVGPAGVSAALALSYQHLRPDRRRMLRLVGQHPGPVLTAPAMAALAGVDVSLARDHLDALVAEHLLRQLEPDRYQAHDLVREYATARSADEDPASARRQALERLLEYYLRAAGAAMDVLYPQERQVRPPAPAPGVGPAVAVPVLADPAAAMTWLDAELGNLLALPARASADGWPGRTATLAADLAAVLARHLDIVARHSESIELHQLALAAARSSDDRPRQAKALYYLAMAQTKLGRTAALHGFRSALAIWRELGDRTREATALHALAHVQAPHGRYREAKRSYQHIIDLTDAAPISTLPDYARLGLAEVQIKTGDCASALDNLAEFDRGGANDRLGSAWATNYSGMAYRQLGRYADAVAQHHRALDLHRVLGDITGEALAESNLGVAHRLLGQIPTALRHGERASALAGQVGDPGLSAQVGNDLADTLRAAGRHAEALAGHKRALTAASRDSDWHEQARAHEGIAATLTATGHTDKATSHRSRALSLYRKMGLGEAAPPPDPTGPKPGRAFAPGAS
jgi:tetratricopeptide (TPR) repeat protein